MIGVISVSRLRLQRQRARSGLPDAAGLVLLDPVREERPAADLARHQLLHVRVPDLLEGVVSGGVRKVVCLREKTAEKRLV